MDFDGDGTATWQEFGNQRGSGAAPIATPVPTPTHTPTPAPNEPLTELVERINAFEQALAALMDLVNSLVDRISVLEENGHLPQPTATPIPVPTATPRPDEPTPTPLPTDTPAPTSTPRPPAALSPSAQMIDSIIKSHFMDIGQPLTDTEIVGVCEYLRDTSWDFFGLPLSMSDRDYDIAAAIFLNTTQHEMQMYCDEKRGT